MPPKRHSKIKYKKAPGAPLRFKSAYMFFNIAKQKEIRSSMPGGKLSTTKIATMVSHAWKSLPDEHRAAWEDMAKQDRARFELEKKRYAGPWKVPVKKDPRAPKRPMSAYLDFSNSRRAQFRKIYPSASNGQLSIILAKEWKEAPSEVKKEYIEREARLREQYKRDLAAWEEANTGNVEGGLGGGDDDVDDGDDDENQEEEDRKPPAIEHKSKRHNHESIDIDESSKVARSEITAPDGASRQHPGQDTRFLADSSWVPGSQQPAVSHYASLIGSREDQEESSQSNNAILSSNSQQPPSSSVDQQVLVPLISTDVGGFLAAAAALSASSSEDSSAHAGHQTPPPPAATTDATSPSAMDMNTSLRFVVSQLPPESMKDTDLPKTPSD